MQLVREGEGSEGFFMPFRLSPVLSSFYLVKKYLITVDFTFSLPRPVAKLGNWILGYEVANYA